MPTVATSSACAALHSVRHDRRLVRGRPEFSGSCSCGASSGPLPISGMVAGWSGQHRDAATRLPAFIEEPESLSYEAAVLRRQPRLTALLAGGPDGFRGGAR